jgi:small conductance mechanosensitive channel
MSNAIFSLRDQIVLFLPQLAVSILIFLVFWLVSKIVRRIIHGIGAAANLEAEVRELVEDVAGIIVLAFGLITALATLGINVTALVAGLGLTGFALGFALQDIIANTLSGILILMYKPFKTGDYIMVGAHEGTVTDVDLRYTTLRGDANWILVPNQTLFKEAIKVAEPGAQPTDPTQPPPQQGQPQQNSPTPASANAPTQAHEIAEPDLNKRP